MPLEMEEFDFANLKPRVSEKKPLSDEATPEATSGAPTSAGQASPTSPGADAHRRKPRKQQWGIVTHPTLVHAIALLVHATEVGSTDPATLAALTGLPLPIVQEMVGRLRSAGYWTADTVDVSAWGDEARDMDGKLIWLQALVATGRASRIPQEATPAPEGGEVVDPDPGAPTAGS